MNTRNAENVQEKPTHCFHCGVELPDPELPTAHPHGTNERLRIMQARARRGLPLRHPQDAGAVKGSTGA